MQRITKIWNKTTYFLAGVLGVQRKVLTWAVIFATIMFFLQGYANHRFNQILKVLESKPDVEVEVSPYLFETSFGEYLPLIVTNTGDFTYKQLPVRDWQYSRFN